jgi:hypothetical protein
VALFEREDSSSSKRLTATGITLDSHQTSLFILPKQKPLIPDKDSGIFLKSKKVQKG